MDPVILPSLITLLLIACIVAIVAERIRQPYTIALVLVGLVVAVTKLTPAIHISHDVTFTIILPPLLFYGAMHMDLQHLRDNWRSIVMLAFPGVIISTLFIGVFLHFLLGLDIIYAFLFGALISPTDPISVLSILKKAGAPERLRTVLEGESLFNDGTGVVVFSIILGIVSGHGQFSLGQTFVKFLVVAGGGTLIGLAFGLLAYKILRNIDDHLLEVAITICLTFGTPLVAEYFHFSGIIAVVVAGLIIGNYGKLYSMSAKTCETLDTFWEVIEFMINSILFLVIGIELQEISIHSLGLPVFFAVFAVLISRIIVVYPVVWLRNLIAGNDIPPVWSHVMFWGGLKGSISIALVVGLPHSFQYRELFLMLAFAVVVFSLIIQGLTMKPLINRLKLSNAHQ